MTFRRNELRQLAEVFVIANTPRSLYTEILATGYVNRVLKTYSIDNLLALYSRVTAKPNRSEVTAAFLYLLLISIYKSGSSKMNEADSSCLDWGPLIQTLAQSNSASSQIISLGDFNNQNPQIGGRPNVTIAIN